MNIFVINLDHRADRLDHATKEFNTLGLSFERFNAIKHEFGSAGCAMSHEACLKLAKERNYDYCMICEDDVKFFIDINELNKYINNFLKDDMIKVMVIMGVIPTKETIRSYNDIFYTSTDIQTTTCYLVKKNYYDKLIDSFNYSHQKLLETKIQCHYAPDVTWKNLQKEDIFVIPKICAGCQYDSYSDIEKRFATYEPSFRFAYL